MLLVIVYIRLLDLDEIVDDIHGKPLPSIRPRIKEYNKLEDLHKQLCTRFAEEKSKHQRHKQNLEDATEFYYFPPQKRMSSQDKQQDRRLAVKRDVTLKHRFREKTFNIGQSVCRHLPCLFCQGKGAECMFGCCRTFERFLETASLKSKLGYCQDGRQQNKNSCWDCLQPN